MKQDDLPLARRTQGRFTRQEVPQSWVDMLAAHVDKTYRLGFAAEAERRLRRR